MLVHKLVAGFNKLQERHSERSGDADNLSGGGWLNKMSGVSGAAHNWLMVCDEAYVRH